MKIESVAVLINEMSSQRNYSKSRVLILREYDRLIKNLHLLNDDAKQFVKIIKQEKESGTFNSLTKSEKKIIILINQSINELKLPYAKRLYIQYQTLIERQEAQNWLSSDAKFICSAWKQGN